MLRVDFIKQWFPNCVPRNNGVPSLKSSDGCLLPNRISLIIIVRNAQTIILYVTSVTKTYCRCLRHRSDDIKINGVPESIKTPGDPQNEKLFEPPL